jgi:hypothetical protein
MQSADLTEWEGDTSDMEWLRLVEAISALIGSEPRVPEAPPIPEPQVPEPSIPEPPVPEPPVPEPQVPEAPSAPEPPPPVGLPLSDGARVLVDEAEDLRKHDHPHLGVNHWLLALLERHGPMAESLAPDLDLRAMLRQTTGRVMSRDPGPPFSLDDASRFAAEHARKRGKDRVFERDLAAAILVEAGYLTR